MALNQRVMTMTTGGGRDNSRHPRRQSPYRNASVSAPPSSRYHDPDPNPSPWSFSRRTWLAQLRASLHNNRKLHYLHHIADVIAGGGGGGLGGGGGQNHTSSPPDPKPRRIAGLENVELGPAAARSLFESGVWDRDD